MRYYYIFFICLLASCSNGKSNNINSIDSTKVDSSKMKDVVLSPILREGEDYIFSEAQLDSFLRQLKFVPDSLFPFCRFKNRKPDFDGIFDMDSLHNMSRIQYYSVFQRQSDENPYKASYNNFLAYEKFSNYTRLYIYQYVDFCCNVIYVIHYDERGVKQFESEIWKVSVRDGTSDSFSTYSPILTEKRIKVKSNHGFFNDDFSKFENDEVKETIYEFNNEGKVLREISVTEKFDYEYYHPKRVN